ncbi:D-3-phosphoglycerate dehydrogenase [Parapedobacter luteus]|uniref:D-3-phosphoglycerate dehydrogenase n=1 Tax=Parapedobacter luteus TaxID=623280 RepID=A0A1T5B069_9SPHI|nr:D-2-hydroxyacid dehydrogenase [Parapedobacter luteus]SKB40457.1 D-3-phosphoglycerate dehydrogenase [Parapedobacter luteus]
MKILANDGIDPLGKLLLEKAGFTVDTNHIPQKELPLKLPAYDAITVRSATKVRQALIDVCPNLKLIGRGGVGMDNIDVDYALAKGIAVVNTPAASSLSVAELVFAHLLGGVRFLYDAQRKMPLEGDTNFGGLKKAYAKGVELRGKTLGIVGFGRIGKETAKVGLGLGMDVMVSDLFEVPAALPLTLSGGITVDVPIKQVALAELLQNADFISLHVPFTDKPIIGKDEFELLKPGVGLVNASRGGVIDELALIDALNSGKVAFAGLDVFENEPTPRKELLTNPRVSLTPHIGAATNEAQERIGEELANLIIQTLKK